jgi:hypothetical protein
MKLLSVNAMLRTTSTYTKMCKQNQTMDIDALVQNFRDSQKERDEEEEEENDTVLEEKCTVKTYHDAVKSLKELQEFAAQENDSDMLGVLSQANVFVESQAAKTVKREL